MAGAAELDEFYLARKLTIEHPVHGRLPRPATVAAAIRNAGLEQFVAWLQRREAAIRAMESDPLSYGWEASVDAKPQGMPDDWRPMWADAERLLAESTDLLVMGGNRSSKSEWAAKQVGKAMSKHRRGDRGKPPSVWCLAYSEETSKRDQQPYVWKYLPNVWKDAKSKGITYNERAKFSGNYFVSPNAGECWFKFYKQDPTSLEGGQIDLAWADELIPVEQLVTLRGRTVDRHGKIIVTFTPIYGWNSTVADYVTGAKVEEYCDCPLFPTEQLWPGLPVGKVPYIMRCLDSSRAVIFFQPRWNPWIDYQSLVQLWQHRGRVNILIRLHGVTTKTTGGKFPKFGRVNIVPADRIPSSGCDYHFLDFAWQRPWAQVWIRVKRVADRRFVYVVRDWPDKASFGEWVEPSDEKKDGKKGPAQNPIGYGTREYASLARQVESDAKLRVFERYGDPRSGAASAVTEDHGGTDLISMMAEHDVFITPAKGVNISEGINILNDWLDYDEERPVDAMNQPSLYISEACEQVIDCLRMWTGGDGEKGAAKDFIDLLRYAATADVDELTDAMLVPRTGWGGY